LGTQALIDTSGFDPARPKFDIHGVRSLLPHRFEFEQLSGLFEIDGERQMAIGFKRYTEEEFWVRGHVPGSPLLPGVLMIEACAQLGACYCHHIYKEWGGFWALAAVDKVRYRGAVRPGDTVIYVDKLLQIRSRLMRFQFQGVLSGKIVVEGELTGMRVEAAAAVG